MSPKTVDERKELFAKRLEDERKLRGITQKDLGLAIGVKSATISQWEAKGALPSRKNLEKLSEYFGIDKDYLLGNIPAKNPNGDPSTYPTSDEEKDDPAKYGKLLGRSPDFRTEINNCVYILKDKNHTHYLYNFLLLAKDFDGNQWQTINLWADTLSKCYIPKVKARHPLTSLSVYRSFFTKTLNAIQQINSDLKKETPYKSINYHEPLSMLENFDYSLLEDYKNFPKTFKSIDELKKANNKTTTCIEKISKSLKNCMYTDAIKENELLQNFFSSLIEDAYEADLKNIIEFVNDTE